MNSVFNNNNANPYGMYQGMQYGQPPKDLVWTNALTPEEEKALHKGPSSLSLDIPKEDMYRAKCTHRDPQTKNFTLRENADGSVTCLKCGATFNVVDNVSPDEIRRVVGGALDILQTTKMAYIDMTPEVIQSYFVILPFLEIAPKLYEAAMNTLNNAVPGMGMTNNYVPGDMFQMLNNAVGAMGMPMQQPYMNAPVYNNSAYGGYQQQQMSQVPFGQNPMQMGYQPQQNMQMQQPVMGMPGQTIIDQNPQNNQQMASQQPPKEGEPAKVTKNFDLG